MSTLPAAQESAPECPIVRAHLPRRSAAHRWALASVGVVSVGVGALGVFVPGLPTTVFLIIASWCFARSCPWLEERLIRVPLFRPFLRFLEPGTVMPMRARVIALAMMWAAISISTTMLALRGAPIWVDALVPAAGLAGTWFIWRVAR